MEHANFLAEGRDDSQVLRVRRLCSYHNTSTLSRSFCLKRQDKILEAMVREQVVSDSG